MERNALRNVYEFKAFYEEQGRKPSNVSNPVNKDEEKETFLSEWFRHVRKAKYEKGSNKLYPSVDKILTELLGDDWYEDFEKNALIKANEFKDFYEKNKRKPSSMSNPITEKDKKEKNMAGWFKSMKQSKNGKSTLKLYPSVEKILVNLLGQNWYENEDLEQNSLIKANEFKTFYKNNKRKPRYISNPTTDEIKTENSISIWFSNMQKSKIGKSKVTLYPSVEKILVNLLGEVWYETNELEKNALIKANEFKEFHEEHGRKPVGIKNPTSELENFEKRLSKWFSHAKEDKRNGKDIYPSVEKILVDLLGKNWYDPEPRSKKSKNIVKQPVVQSSLQLQSQLFPQEDLCTSIFKSGINKDKVCGKKNCKVHKKEVQNFNSLVTEPAIEQQPLPIPQKQENLCTSIFKSGVNKGKVCGKKNCGVHKEVKKSMALPQTILPNPQPLTNPPSDHPRAPRPQCELSLLHKEYKTFRSDNLAKKFRERPQLWHDYHRIAEANEASFPDGEVPYQRVIAWLKTYLSLFKNPKKQQKTIVDMGCGTARVQKAFADRPNLTFHNLDHVACDDRVTVADIAHTALEDGDADVAILCLAMWGSNKEEYLTEAFRLLDPNGRLIIVEPSKRWMDEETGKHRLCDLIERHGFTVEREEVKLMTDEQQVHKFSLFVVKK